jgi:hypothetical protein
MNKAEIVAGAVVLAIGATLLAGSLQFPYTRGGEPGPGFLPLWIAFGIIGGACMLLARGFRARLVPEERITWPAAAGWRRVALMLGALAVSFLALEELGFLVVATAFMVVMVFSLGGRSWRLLASVPLLSAIALYGIFAVWLRVPLPKGILVFFE